MFVDRWGYSGWCVIAREVFDRLRPRSSLSRVDQVRVLKLVLIQATSHAPANAIVEEVMACHRGGVVVQLWALWPDMTFDLGFWSRET
jgi:hypothetical protein